LNKSPGLIKSRIRALRFRVFLITYGTLALRFIFYLSAAFVFISGINSFVLFLPVYIRALSGVMFAAVSVKTIIDYGKIRRSRPLSVKSINRIAGEKKPALEDSVVNLFSLKKEQEYYCRKSRISSEIINGLEKRTARQLAQFKPCMISIKKFKADLVLVLALILTVALFNRVFPDFFRDSFENTSRVLFSSSAYSLEVFPGSESVKRNSDLKVSVLTDYPSLPSIEVERYGREETGKFERTESGLIYNINDIGYPLKYRVFLRGAGIRSQWYEVDIDSPPEVDEITLKYEYPAYTGKKDKVDSGGYIEALRGTTVKIDVKASGSAPLEKAYIETGGEKIPMRINEPLRATGSIFLQSQRSYTVNLVDENGLMNEESAKYQINVLRDENPSVKLYEPTGDMDVPEDATINISGEAVDDIGIKDIAITYYTGVGGEKRVKEVKAFDEAPERKRFSYAWNIAETGALSGSVITFRIRARDVNDLYGPGEGYSERIRLNVKGFRQKHKEIIDESEELQDDLLSMLEKAYEASESLKGEDFKEGLEKLSELKGFSKDYEKALESLIEKMKEDPYMDSSTVREFEGLLEGIKNINTSFIDDAIDSAASGDTAAAEKTDAISSRLEQMMRVFDDVVEEQRMSDLLSSSSASLETARDLADMMGEDSLEKEDFLRQLDKLQSLMEEIRSSLLEYPDRLPDEFINMESVESLDFSESAEGMSDLGEALKDGDYDRAKEILEKLTKSLEGMLDTLTGAAGETYGSRQQNIRERSGWIQEMIYEIIKEQERLISRTEKIKETARRRKKDYDKEMIEKIREEYEVLKSTTGIYIFEVEREFREGYLYRTPELLKQQKDNIDEEWKKERIKGFLRNLADRRKLKEFLQEKEKKKAEDMSGEQDDLRLKLKEVIKGIESLSHLTAMLNQEIVENLESAGRCMKDASAELMDFLIDRALASQRQALSYLVQSDSKMREFMEKMDSIPMELQASPRYSHSMQPGGIGGSGARGFSEGYVEIPGPEEYFGGEEFRRRVMESLRGEYPERYRNLIEEYFKSLTQ